MPVTNRESGTRIDEIADGIYRISTPVPPTVVPGGFSFNQYLIADYEPLLFHTGSRRLSPLVREAVATVLPVSRLRYVGYSHFESDECGGVNEFLALAPQAVPLCGRINAMINSDAWDRLPRALADGETVRLGKHNVSWVDAPHLPHAWECGYLMEESTRTLLCGDLFTQPGPGNVPLTISDVLAPSEAFRNEMDYFSHCANAKVLLERLASCHPATLVCMHGSAWQGDGAEILRALGFALG